MSLNALTISYEVVLAVREIWFPLSSSSVWKTILLRIFSSDKLIGWMEAMGMDDNEPIEHRWVTKHKLGAQKKVEAQNFNMRKNLLEYDDVMNLQRSTVRTA